MNILAYLKDKSIPIVLQVSGILVVSMFLNILENPTDAILLMACGCIFVTMLYYFVDYRARKQYFDTILSCLEELDKKYLISDVLENPQKLEDKIYRSILYHGNKAMLEEISKTKQEQSNYQEYIEQWVHEVKTPLAAMKLIYENNRTPETKKMLLEIERANRYVEQVLYYARSDNVEKDFLIREVELSDIVRRSILNNKQLLRENQIKVRVECADPVYTDSKWITFILDQCIVNSVKYGAKQLVFKSETMKHKTFLYLIDDGIGILEEDLPRIYEKGFTGNNGHNQGKSTGIGLYLCKKMSEKLDIELRVESESGSYTKVILIFESGRLR